jgi:hypothetical protein
MNADLGKTAGAPNKLTADEKAELAKLPGIVVDDSEAKLKGNWNAGHGIPHLGAGYHYAPKGDNEAAYAFKIAQAGRYEVRLYWAGHENRASNTTVTLNPTGKQVVTLTANQKSNPEGGFQLLGTYEFTAPTPSRSAARTPTATSTPMRCSWSPPNKAWGDCKPGRCGSGASGRWASPSGSCS